MQIQQFTPTKGFFFPGQPLELRVTIDSEQPDAAGLRVSVSKLNLEILTLRKELSLDAGENKIIVKVQSPGDSPQSYGLKAELYDSTGQLWDTRYTAVDTLERWTDFPRYGFLTDFSPDRVDIDETLSALEAYHINGIQFYDWQYRHDMLVPPQDEFTDPLGRALSLQTVRKLVESAHARNIAAMPYLAVYAASLGFWKDHPDWQLYDENGSPLKFEDFLGLMDPSPGSLWIDHLTQQCKNILEAVPFDGLHVDQYGEPRIAFDFSGNPVDLPQAFKSFVNKLKDEFSTRAVVFNAVANWPIEELASSLADFVYIEIWPPDCQLQDLYRIVDNARKQSGGKPVVIALYLHADWPVNIRLANAIIMAAGGSRIELGENGRLLADPYFPKHEGRSLTLVQAMQKYQDFLVRYGQLLGPAAATEETSAVHFPPDTICSLRKNRNWWSVNVINLAGLESPRWDEKLSPPQHREEVIVTVSVPGKPKSVWIASPDDVELDMRPSPFRYKTGLVEVSIPKLFYWSMVIIEFEEENR